MVKQMKRIVNLSLGAVFSVLGALSASAAYTDAQLADVFAKKVDFTVDGYAGTEALANFPVLVKLSSSAVSGFSYSDCAQNSIRFFDASGNLLPHEIDYWNPSGESFIWVSVPTLSGSSTKIMMCYGGSGSSFSSSSDNVWALADYKSVWHMNINAGSTTDSVANYPATLLNPSTVETAYCGAGTGIIGGDYYCNENGKVHCVKTTSIEGFNASTCTYTAWVRQIGGTMVSGRPDSTNYPNITWGSWGNCGEFWNSNFKYNASGNGIAIGVEGGQNAAAQNLYQLAVRDTAEKKANADVSLFDKQWHYVVLRYDDAGRTLYVDGVLQSGFTASGILHNPLTTGTMRMGARQDGANADCVWTGDLDEMRFRAAASSADWLAAEYANVTNSTFLKNAGVVDIGDAPELGWTAEEMTAGGAGFRTDGTLLYAYSRAGTSVNGIPFTNISFTDLKLTTSSAPNVYISNVTGDKNSYGQEGQTGDFASMLANCWIWPSTQGQPVTITLKGLTEGKTYLVQLFAHRNNVDSTADVSKRKDMTFAVDEHVVKIGDKGDKDDNDEVVYLGGSLIGIIQPTASTYDIQVTYAGGYAASFPLNAIQVRELGDTPTPPEPTTYAFYIGETGYDTWADAYGALATNGGTITLGQDATERLDAYLKKNFTIDLQGKKLTGNTGWCADTVTIIDNVGGGSFDTGNSVNFKECNLDLSKLDPDQIINKISANNQGDTTVVVFPASMTVEQCIAKIEKQVSGTKFVVNGDTYVWNGTAWVLDALQPAADAAANVSAIQAAINAAALESPAGTVVLGEGTFEINAALDLKGGVTLKGQGWDNTIIKQTASARCVAITNGAKLEGVTLTGGQSSSGAGAGALVTDGTISWCCISNNHTTAGATSGGGVSFTSGQGTIDHSIIVGNSITGGSWGGGIGGRYSTGTILIDTCLIYGNEDKNGSGGGIGFQNCAAVVTVRNTTVVANKCSNGNGHGLYFNDVSTGGKIVLVNDILTGNGDAECNTFIAKAYFDTTESKNCLISGTLTQYNDSIYKDANVRTLFADQTKVISSAPTFVGAGDYHLAAGSAGIAAGAMYTGIGEDLDHNAFAATPSIGCYEYDAGAQTVVQNPAFSPAATMFSTTPFSVTLSCATDGATIYYTTDGSDPTESSTEYTAPISLSETTTIKAKAFKADCTASAVVSATYTYGTPEPVPLTFGWRAAKMTLDPTSILTDGELVYAYARGDYTANGVEFAKATANSSTKSIDIDDLTWVFTGANFFPDKNYVFSGIEDAGYKDLMTHSWGCQNVDPHTIELKGLTPGSTYLVQIVGCQYGGDNDGKVWVQETTGQTFGTDTPYIYVGGTHDDEAWTYGGSLIGVFKAESNTKTITLKYASGSWAGFNAVQVRDVTPVETVEPTPGDAAKTRQDIQAAIDGVASLGGQVVLGEGLYEIDAQLMVTNGVTLQGQGWEKTTIRQTMKATSAGQIYRCATVNGGAQLVGLTLSDGSLKKSFENGGGVLVLDGDVSWCMVTNCTADSGIGGGIGIGSSEVNGKVRVDHTIVTGCSAYDGGGIGVRASMNSNTGRLQVEIDTCLVYGNSTSERGSGIDIVNKSTTDYIADTKVITSVIRNTTVVGNEVTGSGAGAGFYTTQQKTTLVNCIFSDNTVKVADGRDPNVAIQADSTSEVVAKTSNCFFGNGSTVFGGDSIGDSGSVGFKNAQDGDYRLADLSPAISAGIASAGLVTDLKGDAFENPPSLGCYEYDGEDVEVPQFDPVSGTRAYPEVVVTLSCATDGATVRYTTDGSMPTAESAVYTGPITLSTDDRVATVKARAFKDGLNPSGIVTARYQGAIFPVADDPTATWRSIQDAIDAAAALSPVGTVFLGEGTFMIDKQLMVTNGVTLVGQGWEKTTLKQVGAAGTNTRVATLMDDSVLRGVTVTGGNLSGSWTRGAGVLIKAGTVTWCCISNNVINGWNAVGGGVSFYYEDKVGHGQVDHSIITGNEIVHGTQKGGYGAGIGMRNGDGDVVIDTCLIYGNRVSTGDNNFGGGVGQDGGTSVAGGGYLLTIRNTTISDNYSKGKAGGLYVGSSWRAELENVILAGNLAGESESNIAFNGTSSSQTRGNNNLFGLEDEMLGENATFGDPAFVDPDNGDYSLLATSPACDAGKWYEGIVVDLDGNAREDPSDIGCYELLGEIAFGRAKATAVRSTAVSLSTELLRIGETATGADVYLAYGTDAGDLGESILVKEGAVAEEPLTQLLTGLDRETTYYYCFYATNNATPAANSIRKGSFTTPTAELLTLGKPFVDASATRANVNLRVLKLGEDATAAEVWFQWGTEPDALGESVLVNPDADVNEVSTGEMTGLEKGMTYYFRFSVTNNAPADAQAKAVDGEFTTPQPEHLVLGTPVASPRATSATVSLQVVTLGEGATYASVYFYCYDKDGTEINRTTLAAVKGETCVATLPELGPNEVYTYRFVVTNNGTPVETKEASGSFMTLNSDYDHAYGDYPATVPAGSVVTFVASDDITPFRVVSAEDYTEKVHSTSMNKDFYFRSEADFESNASAMIGEDYYLFLGDAVRAAVTSNTIEVIRDNNMVAETMQIKIPLTINGNGHTVKVNTPFVSEAGYVNTNCTVSPKVVFQIQNGGDVLLRDMKVMGGGQQLMGNAEGLNEASTPAIVVGNTQSLTQTGATGILQLENVTVTRSQGALFVAQGALAYVDRCQLVRNCRYCAGGIYNRGTCVVVNSSMSENRSLYSVGGGGAIENQGTMYMNNCVICNNSSTEDGGAINEFSNIGGSKLYMMNSTLSGNFSTRYEYDGGGMALRGNGAKFYAVNNLICNNYYYNNSGSGSVTPSDLRFPDNATTENGMYYNVYGDVSGKVAASMNGQAITAGGDFGSALAAGGNAMVVDDNQDVFLDYYAATRVYQNLNDTKIKIDGSRLYQSSTEPLARYAPIDPYGKGVLGDAGALTYFDASDWRDGVVRMSYRTLNGEMTALGGIPMATEDDLVTTFYESEIVPDTIERSIGIAGASGWVLSDVKYWTLKLIEDPKYGSVDNITIFGDTYHDGATVVITATPEKYCTFLGWYDEADNLVSPSAVTAVLMTRDIDLKAKFSPPAAVMDLDVLCEQTAPTHENFRISITTNWLAEAFSDICPDGVVTSVNSNEVAAALNDPDPDNGLNHVWQNYVLGLKKGEKNGRIWINSVQTENAGTIRLFTQPLIPVQASGFSVKYRLDRKQGGDWTRTTTVNENSRETAGEFDVATSVNTNGNYVVDLIFIPDGYMTSEEYVTSVNTAGVLKVESAKAVEILAAPWSAFAPSNTPASVSAAEYVKAKCLTPGDRLYVYDQAVGKYEAWKVALDGASWQPIAVFTLVNGVVTATEQIPASQAFIPRGSGVWLERQDVTKPIYLYGQLDSRTVTMSLEPGFNLVGNPYPTTFDASRFDEPAPSGIDGDHIAIPTGGAPMNYYWDNGSWGYTTNVVTGVSPITGNPKVQTRWVSDGMTLPVGYGFWYRVRGTEPVELTWPVPED